MSLSAQDEQTIRKWAEKMPSPAVIRLARESGEGDEALSGFCDALKRLAPETVIKPGPDDPYRSPALIIGRHENIAYQAVPQGKELAPFLALLRSAADDADDDAAPYKSLAARMTMPTQLILFIAMQCPHCPQAVRDLFSLAHHSPLLRLAVVDGALFPTRAADANIRSVPTLILDDQLRWSGPLDVNEVVEQCIHRDPAQLSGASLRQIIESGEAAHLATMMTDYGQIFPAFLDLVVHPRWSVRLGAMVTIEYLADDNLQLAAALVVPLWERFPTIDVSAQGDVIQVFGQIRSNAAKDYLKTIATGDYDASVKEAAQEELDEWMQ